MLGQSISNEDKDALEEELSAMATELDAQAVEAIEELPVPVKVRTLPRLRILQTRQFVRPEHCPFYFCSILLSTKDSFVKPF